MPRPVKWRKVEYIPQNKYFAPCPKGDCGKRGIGEINIKVEELEAMRLKDIEGLTQEECAEKMQVSRQTFQNIIDSARLKVATALLEDKAISVGGGNYTKNICKFTCYSCGNEIFTNYETSVTKCKHCGSVNIKCAKKCNIACERNNPKHIEAAD